VSLFESLPAGFHLLRLSYNEFTFSQKRVTADDMRASRFEYPTMMITVLSQKFRLTQDIRAPIMRLGFEL
jgi:hypothetical protein